MDELKVWCLSWRVILALRARWEMPNCYTLVFITPLRTMGLLQKFLIWFQGWGLPSLRTIIITITPALLAISLISGCVMCMTMYTVIIAVYKRSHFTAQEQSEISSFIVDSDFLCVSMSDLKKVIIGTPRPFFSCLLAIIARHACQFPVASFLYLCIELQLAHDIRGYQLSMLFNAIQL